MWNQFSIHISGLQFLFFLVANGAEKQTTILIAICLHINIENITIITKDVLIQHCKYPKRKLKTKLTSVSNHHNCGRNKLGIYSKTKMFFFYACKKSRVRRVFKKLQYK